MGFSYRDYEESDEVRRAREELQQNSEYHASDQVNNAYDTWQTHLGNQVGPWTGGTYGQALQDQLNAIANRKEFTYDLNADALYQQYKDQYITGGKYAMMDTMGQAAALTGGYGNSYASTAGNQAYQAYLQKLNDVVPDLYKLALDKYNQEGQDMKDLYGMYANEYGREYGEYRDQVGDWQDQADRLQNAYYNERDFDYSAFADNRDYLNNYYNNERNFDYGQYSDAYARAFANYQQQVAEQQYWASYNQRASSGSGSSGRDYNYNTWSQIESQAAKYANDPDQLYAFLSAMVADGHISQEDMDHLYLQYANGSPHVAHGAVYGAVYGAVAGGRGGLPNR